MVETVQGPLRDLVLAMNLGHSTAHPLGGWQLLRLLYRDGSSLGEPITLRYLIRQYNAAYLDAGERPLDETALRNLLGVLVDKVHLIDETTRKVRFRLDSGKYIIRSSSVFRLTSSGIEFINAMQRVVNAENTVVASVSRIGEFVGLVQGFRDQQTWQTETVAFHDRFTKMLEAYQDVMNGMRKLDVDLREIATDLSFNHAGAVAQQLQTMLKDEALPAYQQVQGQARAILQLSEDQALSQALALSAQAKGSLDAQRTVGDAGTRLLDRQTHEQAITRQLHAMALSFDPTTSAIQNSFDSIYLLFDTLWSVVKLLTAEFDHVRAQSVDLKALTHDIDDLLTHSERLVLPQGLPRHLAMDRLDDAQMASLTALPAGERGEAMAELTANVRSDLLEAGSMPPVVRQLQESLPQVYTAADNPQLVVDEDLTVDKRQAMAEFDQVVMHGQASAVISGELRFSTSTARDLVVTLYSATQYRSTSAFAAFGRPLLAAAIVPGSQPVRLIRPGEQYVAVLPHAFKLTFATEELADE